MDQIVVYIGATGPGSAVEVQIVIDCNSATTIDCCDLVLACFIGSEARGLRESFNDRL